MTVEVPVKNRRATSLMRVSTIDKDLSLRRWRFDRNGYPRTWVGKRQVSAHRIVMERMLGRSMRPGEIVDHIDFDPTNNTRGNLRITDHFGSMQHRRFGTANRPRGVTYHKGVGKWQSQVRHRGRMIYCGLFDSATAAGEAAAQKRFELGFLGEPSTMEIK